MRRLLVVATLLALLNSGCGPNSSSRLATQGPSFVTSTLPATPSPSMTPQQAAPTPAPTSAPIAGITSTQLYVRAEPSSASAQIGLLAAATAVQVLGKDPGNNWYQLVYAGGKDGRGWVSAQYVQVSDKNAVPVIAALGSAPSGSILQQVNVRKGPDSQQDSLGILNPKDVVALTGRSGDSTWIQIQYGDGPDGRGWVAASYVQAQSVDALPIVASSGAVIGTATTSAVAATAVAATAPSPVVPARQDNDSISAPAVNIKLSPAGAGSFIYSSDVSTPDGDTTDWIAFTPAESTVSVRLSCAGNGQLTTQLMSAGQALQNWDGLSCGQDKRVPVVAGQAYLLKIEAAPSGAQLQYVRYTLSVNRSP